MLRHLRGALSRSRRLSSVSWTNVEQKLIPGTWVTNEIAVEPPHLRLMDRAASDAILEEMQRIEEGVTSPAVQNEDWDCGNCGFSNYASKSLRMFCAKCGSLRSPLPSRSSYLLTGPRGSGKSCALARIVFGARQRGWIALVVPSAWHYVNAGVYVTPSKLNPGLFEQPNGALAVLQATKDAHSRDALEKVALLDTRWGATAADLLDAALQEDRIDDASSAVNELVLSLAASDTVPCLVAVDEISSWFTDGIIYYFKRKQLRPDDVVSVATMKAPLTDAGAFAGKKSLAVFADSTSRQIALRSHFRAIVPHMPVEVPVAPFTDTEFKAALERYRDAFNVDPIDDQKLRSLMMCTQRNPKLLFERMLMT